jgi:hypothetical protein
MTDIVVGDPISSEREDQQESKPHALHSNHVGLVDLNLYNLTRDEVLELLHGCVILNVERNSLTNRAKYMIEHPDLDELKYGELAPEYMVMLEKNGDGTRTRKFVRVTGRFMLSAIPCLSTKWKVGTDGLVLVPIEFRKVWEAFCEEYKGSDDPIAQEIPPYVQPVYSGTLTFADPKFVKFNNET